MKARPAKAKGRKRMTTFTSTDAELRRLLYWYNKHRDKILQANEQVGSHNTAFSSSSLKNSEKQERIKVLRAAEMTWRESQRVQHLRQQLITKYYSIKPKATSDLA